MLRIILILLISVYSSYALAAQRNILDVDFKQSMTDSSKYAWKILTQDKSHANNLKFFQELYDAKKPSKMPDAAQPLIPKVMHHIWFGKEIPPLYQHYINECKNLHPDWEFKMWGEEEIAALGLEHQDIYNKVRTYPGKSDIARFEILYRFGGVYKDLDVKCYRPIDELNYKYDFYVPLEYPMKHWGRTIINSGIIGATAKNKILKRTLELIKNNFDRDWESFDNGNEKNRSINSMTVKTSMLPLTDAFVQTSDISDQSIALPATYFIPLGYDERPELSIISKFLVKTFQNPARKYFQFIKPETLMWHNFDKEEVVFVDFEAGNGLNDPTRELLFKKLSIESRQIFNILKKIYNNNLPKKVGWSKKSKTPQIIHFVVFNTAEKEELEKHLPDWKMFNGDFDINIWDQAKINAEFPEEDQLHNLTKNEDLRFYIALKVLEKFGGNYANFNAKPLNSVFELGNKYNFYAGLMPINKKSLRLSLSQKLLGASHKHPIISKTLAQINPQDNLVKINEVFIREAYKNIYFYDEISGKNLVLPAIYFEALDPIKDEFWYIPYDYLVRFVKNIPKAFTEVYGCSIVN